MPPRKKQKVCHSPRGDTENAGPSACGSISDGTDRDQLDAGAAATAVPDVKGKRVLQRRKGCLKDLPGFAVELQLQIFGQLHPRDLLNLSQTCKMFRAFFLHRSNEPLWKASIKNADDLPERPPYLSEVAFIHLLYSPYCHNCGSTIVRKVIWQWFVRLCPKCVLEVSFSRPEMRDSIYNRNGVLLDTSTLRGPMFNIYYHRNAFKYARFYKPHIDRFSEELGDAASRTSAEECVKRRATFEKLELEARERRTHAQRLMNWSDQQEEDRAAVLVEKRKERFTEIVKRLQEKGWDKEIAFLGENGLRTMSRLPVVRQSTKLTEGSWNKVLTALNGFLNKTRAQRLDRERRETLRSRFLALDKAVLAHYVQLPRNANMDCRPEYIDFAMMETCRAIADQPSTVLVTQEDFASIVPTLADEWEATCKKELLDYFLPHLGPIPDDVNPLELATAVLVHFNDYQSTVKILHYPAILGFAALRVSDDTPECMYEQIAGGPLIGPFAERRLHAWNPPLKRPFSLSSFTQSGWFRDATAVMRGIVTALGLDPARATVEDLRQCAVRLQCVTCCANPVVRGGETVAERQVYNWEAALQHSARKGHSSKEHKDWERVSPADLDAVRTQETKEHGLSLGTKGCVWACSLCEDVNEKAARMKQHLKNAHKIDNADDCVDDGTIYPHPCLSAMLTTPPITIPQSQPS